MKTGQLALALILLLLGAAAGYFFGFDIGWERALEEHGVAPELKDDDEVTPPNEDKEEQMTERSPTTTKTILENATGA